MQSRSWSPGVRGPDFSRCKMTSTLFSTIPRAVRISQVAYYLAYQPRTIGVYRRLFRMVAGYQRRPQHICTAHAWARVMHVRTVASVVCCLSDTTKKICPAVSSGKCRAIDVDRRVLSSSHAVTVSNDRRARAPSIATSSCKVFTSLVISPDMLHYHSLWQLRSGFGRYARPTTAIYCGLRQPSLCSPDTTSMILGGRLDLRNVQESIDAAEADVCETSLLTSSLQAIYAFGFQDGFLPLLQSVPMLRSGELTAVLRHVGVLLASCLHSMALLCACLITPRSS